MREDLQAMACAATEARRYGIPLVLCDGAQGAAARDAHWFKANPKRAYRLRPVEPDEEVPTGCAFVIVSRLSNGARSRMFTSMPGIDAAVDADDGLIALVLAESNHPTGCSVATLMAMHSFQKGGMQ